MWDWCGVIFFDEFKVEVIKVNVMAVKIRTINENDVDTIIGLAHNGEPGIRANNRMIYYLSTTVLKEYVFICEDEENKIGYVFGILNCDKKSLWIHQLVVSKDERGKGYGIKLLEHIESKARTNNIENIELMVRPDNKARFLYQKLGYIEGALNSNTDMFTYKKQIH